jgi:2-polyprenyl-3-methyl-5-hydroxy-6-metoxy-1,4-benzoquinol methylase
MKIHYEELSDVTRYLETHKNSRLEDKAAQAESMLRVVGKRVNITPETKILEVGTGTGWFPLYCQRKGLQCRGLEISPQLVAHARKLAAAYGLECNIELGNLEETDLGENQYDVIVCSNVFEHVENWRLGLRKVHRALKPGGVMFFESTNKFSFTSAEYSFPLYGWLPDALRYKLRIFMQGPDVMKLGIDFNQFTNWGLKAEFRKIGFREMLDRMDLADENHVSAAWKKPLVRLGRTFPPLRFLLLTFSDVTRYLCVK